jgi:hypothetical protein
LHLQVNSFNRCILCSSSPMCHFVRTLLHSVNSFCSREMKMIHDGCSEVMKLMICRSYEIQPYIIKVLVEICSIEADHLCCQHFCMQFLSTQVVFAGATRAHLKDSIRSRLVQQCSGSVACSLINCHQLQCSHNPKPIMNVFLQSKFCLQPRGDTPTRRSTFDGMIAGCIPVFFMSTLLTRSILCTSQLIETGKCYPLFFFMHV